VALWLNPLDRDLWYKMLSCALGSGPELNPGSFYCLADPAGRQAGA